MGIAGIFAGGGASNVKWFGVTLAREVHLVSDRTLLRMSTHLQRAMQQKVGVSAGGNSRYARAVRATRGSVKRGPLKAIVFREMRKGNQRATGVRYAKREYQKYRHSRPGEPPRKITGFLQRNIAWRRVNSGIYRVGLFKNAMYGWFLDQGVRNGEGGWRIAPRPWMRTTLLEQKANLAAIAAGGGS